MKARRKGGLFLLFLLCGGLGAGGGLLADKRTTEEILNQVVLSLDRQPAVTERKPSHERGAFAKTVTSPQDEIPHLRRVIDEKENEEKQVARDVFSGGAGIVVIHSSYGIPVLRRPADASAVLAAQPPWNDERALPVRADASSLSDSRGQEVLAAPLVPVEVLTPVRPLYGRQTVR